MLSFLAGQNVAVSFDLAGLGLTPTAVEYAVLDQAGTVLVARTALGSWSAPATTANVVVLAVRNNLATGEQMAARTVNLYVTGFGGAAGTVLLSQSYRLVPEDQLAVPSLSFQTMAGAQLLATQLMDGATFLNASEADRIKALIAARNKIAALRFYYTPEDAQSRVMGVIDIPRLSDLSATEFASLDITFREDLRRAQIQEAVVILQHATSVDQSFVDAGVSSITIGESSRTFSTTKSVSVSRPVSSKTLKILSRYMAPARIARA